MNFDFSAKLDSFLQTLSAMSLTQGLVFVAFFLAVWFLPAILALFLNRKHLGKIFLASIPAGLSWVAWVALLAWAVTGKMRLKKGEQAGNRTSNGSSQDTGNC